MRSRLALPAMMLCLLAPLGAQEAFPHHNLTFGAGAGVPQDRLKNFLDSSGAITVGYGYRFHRYFQADLGLDVVFGAARVRDFLLTEVGDLRIKDREYFIPFGGRAIAPLFHGRLLLSGGGGGTYMRYAERVRQPSNFFRVDCPICTSRSGWGYYAQVNASVFIDHNQHFRLGATSRFVRGHTEGEQLGNVPSIRTTDHWVNTFAEIGFSF